MEDGDECVSIKLGVREWRVRSAALCACSAVIDGIIRGSDPKQSKILNMPHNIDAHNVDAFVSLATLTSHDRDEGALSMHDVSEMTAAAMPLVHMYDCSALLKILQSAQNEFPTVHGIMAIVEHEHEAESASWQWVGREVQLCLVHYIFASRDALFMSAMQKKQQTEEMMKRLPAALLANLFLFIGTEAERGRGANLWPSSANFSCPAPAGAIRHFAWHVPQPRLPGPSKDVGS